MNIKEIPLDHIQVSEFNTRKDLDAGNEDSNLDDLKTSIQEKGLLTPITVHDTGNDTFDVIAGQRRYLACKQLGMNTIPCIVRNNISNTDATVISLIENVHRSDMHPLDKAKAYQQLYEKYNDYDHVAKDVGVKKDTIIKYTNMLRLSPKIQEIISTTEGHVGIEKLSMLANKFEKPEEQEMVYNEIAGLNQGVSKEILKLSEGDINKIPELVEQAQEGLFNIRTCHEGLCFDMSDELKDKVKEIMDIQKTSKTSLKDILSKFKL